ncbi:pyruvate transporter MPC1 [Aspergillus mulundensis]|uniref:Mitochondrial pyruvate carrier n=1 Tax=Aspergillus mulundensis TaxID=1810919 RepID=A0A3D8Q7X6_9EURO|nr:Mitochondrial pyruvate carrier [Aspergillus mulundensis]RDW57926.1 Mitochondrial pyruvate carrier [Aspergillus mulundensis]
MAAVIKAINAKIRSNKVADYVCSTHFWGPVSNFGIPVAAVMDTQKDPEMYVYICNGFLVSRCQVSLAAGSAVAEFDTWQSISGQMTGALVIYSATFMRYALAVSPKNYLLFACHAINFSAQCTQGYRYLNYWNWGGREAALAAQGAQKGKEATEAGK